MSFQTSSGASVSDRQAALKSQLQDALSRPNGAIVLEVRDLKATCSLMLTESMTLRGDGFTCITINSRGATHAIAIAPVGGLSGVARIGLARGSRENELTLSLNGSAPAVLGLAGETPTWLGEANSDFIAALRSAEIINVTDAGALQAMTTIVGRRFDEAPDALAFDGTPSFTDDFERLSLRRGGPTRAGYAGGSGIWRPRLYFEEDPKGSANTANSEWQWNVDPAYGWSRPFTPFAIEGSSLRIRAEKADRLNFKSGEIPTHPRSGKTYPYVSGVLINKDFFSQRFGYFECRAMLPSYFASWPAFWTGSSDDTWPPEIDIAEHLGRYPSKVNQATHYEGGGGDGGMTEDLGFALGDAFHSYGALWLEKSITFFVDGRRTRTINITHNQNFNKPQYLILQNAVGDDGSWVGVPNRETPDVIDTYFDWVRAWKV